MEYRRHEIGAGLVVVIAVALLVGMVALSSNIQDLFRPKKEVQVKFEEVEGVERGTPVMQAGRVVGKVDDIEVKRDRGNVIMLTLKVLRETIVKRDSEVSIKSPLVGERYVDMGLGSADSPSLMEGDVLEGKEGLKMDELTDTIVKAVEDVKSITRDIKEITGDPRFKKNLMDTVENMQNASTRIDAIVKRNSPNIDSSLKDLKEITSEVNTTVAEMNKLTKDMNRLMAENRANIHTTIQNLRDTPEQLIEQVELIQKSVSGPVEENREDIKKIMDNLEKISRNLVELTELLKKKPYKLIRK